MDINSNKSKKSNLKNKKPAKQKVNQLITSYYDLNKIYDLNFSDNNFGFSWEIFKAFVTDEWALFYTNCNCTNNKT